MGIGRARVRSAPLQNVQEYNKERAYYSFWRTTIGTLISTSVLICFLCVHVIHFLFFARTRRPFGGGSDRPAPQRMVVCFLKQYTEPLLFVHVWHRFFSFHLRDWDGLAMDALCGRLCFSVLPNAIDVTILRFTDSILLNLYSCLLLLLLTNGKCVIIFLWMFSFQFSILFLD